MKRQTSLPWTSFPWVLPSTYIAGLRSGSPAAGSKIVSTHSSRPSRLVPHATRGACARGYAAWTRRAGPPRAARRRSSGRRSGTRSASSGSSARAPGIDGEEQGQERGARGASRRRHLRPRRLRLGVLDAHRPERARRRRAATSQRTGSAATAPASSRPTLRSGAREDVDARPPPRSARGRATSRRCFAANAVSVASRAGVRGAHRHHRTRPAPRASTSTSAPEHGRERRPARGAPRATRAAAAGKSAAGGS